MSDQILDLTEFLDRVQNDKELLLELLDIFTADYEVKRQQLSDSVKTNNFEEICSIAHSLKGATGNISAKLLREVCLKLELLGKSKDLDGANELLAEMDKQYSAFKTRIESVKKEL